MAKERGDGRKTYRNTRGGRLAPFSRLGDARPRRRRCRCSRRPRWLCCRRHVRCLPFGGWGRPYQQLRRVGEIGPAQEHRRVSPRHWGVIVRSRPVPRRNLGPTHSRRRRQRAASTTSPLGTLGVDESRTILQDIFSFLATKTRPRRRLRLPSKCKSGQT